MHNRAMVGHAEAICQMLFGHVVGFVSQSALPQKHQHFKWVLASHVGSIWGSDARIQAIFWAQIGPSLAILGLLRHLEATALLLAAKLGDLEGKLGYREVMLKLSRAMLCQAEAICQVSFGHVVGFASRNALPQQDQDFKWVSASHVGSIGGSSTAILWLCWHCWRHFGINFRHLGAHDDSMWAQFGGYNRSPKNKISSKTLIPMAGKAQRNQKSAKNASPKS